MESYKYRILIVDDAELMRILIATFLSKMGYMCETATDGFDALEKMKVHHFDAVVTDIKMPNMDGINLTKEISERYPLLPIMVITAYDEEYSALKAISAGAKEYIRKPFSLPEFLTQLNKMIYESKPSSKMETKRDIDTHSDEDIDKDEDAEIRKINYLKKKLEKLLQ